TSPPNAKALSRADFLAAAGGRSAAAGGDLGDELGKGGVGLSALSLEAQLGLQDLGGEDGEEGLREARGGQVGAVQTEGMEAGQRVLAGGRQLRLQGGGVTG